MSYNRGFDIKTIASVLIYESPKAGLISSSSEAKNLTQEQWKIAAANYNGSDEYADKVYEYLDSTEELLD